MSVCITLRGNASDVTYVHTDGRTYLHEIFIGTLNTRSRFYPRLPLPPLLVHKTSPLKLMHRTWERSSCFRGVGAVEIYRDDGIDYLPPGGGLIVFNGDSVCVCVCVC